MRCTLTPPRSLRKSERERIRERVRPSAWRRGRDGAREPLRHSASETVLAAGCTSSHVCLHCTPIPDSSPDIYSTDSTSLSLSLSRCRFSVPTVYTQFPIQQQQCARCHPTRNSLRSVLGRPRCTGTVQYTNAPFLLISSPACSTDLRMHS